MTKTTLEHLDPTTLVIAPNVRLDTRLDKHFIASIKERGVLEPVAAHRDEDGVVTVEFGQRRTLAACQAGCATIPVIIAAERPTVADRLVDQWVENEHRAALTNTERVNAIHQMTLEGLSVNQIAKRTSTTKATVATVVQIAASPTATAQVDQMTLEEAAILAEFDGDEDAMTQLTDCIEEGYWPLEHTAQRIRDDRANERNVAAAVAELAAQGVSVVDQLHDDTARALYRLIDVEGQDLDPIEHAASCTGHVVWVGINHGRRVDDPDSPATKTVPACTGWAEHGHRERYPSGNRSTPRIPVADMTEEQRQKAGAERRHTIESNKAWQAATTVRRAWLASFATRKTAPAGAEVYLATAINQHWGGKVGAHELVNLTSDAIDTELATATPKRALQLALVLTVASWEESTTKDTWRETYREHVAATTLTALQDWGYQLSDIETRLVAGTSRDVI